MITLRLLLGVVTTEDLELEQIDVKRTFLHIDLDERHLHFSTCRLHGDGGSSSLRLQVEEELIWPKPGTENVVSEVGYPHPTAWIEPVGLRPMHVCI